MKRIGWSILALTIVLTACGKATAAAVPPASPTPVEEIIASNPDIVVASALVIPAQISQLGFPISGLVKEVSIKEGDKIKAGQTLVVLDTPELKFAVVAAEAAYNSASLNAELQDMDRVMVVKKPFGHVTFVSLPHEVKFKAIAKADQAQAVLESAQANLAQTILIAPHAGTVTSIDVKPGELVQVDQSILTLAKLDALQIETTDLSERDIVRVKTGQSVDIYIEALDVTVTGRVLRISPMAETVGGDVVYPVTIQLNKQPAGLLWGMTAEVRIQTD